VTELSAEQLDALAQPDEPDSSTALGDGRIGLRLDPPSGAATS
jgi:hypothetical protein